MKIRAALFITAISLSPAPVVAQTTRQVPVESLVYDLKNPDPVRRREAVTLIGTNKVQRAVPDVVALAGDPDVSVRRAVVVTLQELADIGTLAGLVSLTGDPERDIRDQAVVGVTNLYLPKESGLVVSLNKVANFFNPWSDEWAEVVVEPDLTVDPAVVTALVARLQDPHDPIRIKAARALGILRGHAAVPALVTATKEDRSPAVRFESVRALRKIGDPAVAPDILPLTLSTESRLRTEAVLTIGRLHHKPSLPELNRLFTKEVALPKRQADAAYRAALLEAIALIADPSSKDLFVRYREHEDAGLRLQANAGLARLADAALTTDISRDRLAEKDLQVQTAQAFALYRMGRKEYLEELVKALGSRRTNGRAREYLLELRASEVVDLYPLVKLEDANVREALAEILGFIGDDGARPALQELLRDTRGQVSTLANQAIHRLDARARRTTR
jgi:HEAT repeat protein